MTAVPTRRRAGLLIILAAIVLVAGGGIALGLVLSQPAGRSAQPAQPAQLAAVETGCEMWVGSDPAQSGGAQWCRDMHDWMAQQLAGNTMGPGMMWGGPDRMLATCEQWMVDSPPADSTAGATTWCRAMVTWMRGHVGSWSGSGNWSGWMQGSMMGPG